MINIIVIQDIQNIDITEQDIMINMEGIKDILLTTEIMIIMENSLEAQEDEVIGVFGPLIIFSLKFLEQT